MSDASATALNADELLQAATTQSGLIDFGDPGFVEPLRALLDSVAREGRLLAPGVEGLRADIVHHLLSRLQLIEALKQHPEIADEPIDDPIVIVGLPRCGTTKLQRMIAQDTAMQSLPLYKAMCPAPLPDTVAGKPDPRIAMAAGFVALMQQQAPDFMAVHPMQAEEAEEEMFLQLGAFDGPASWGMFYRAPAYVSQLHRWPRSRSYAYLKRMLQWLQWQDSGRRDRPWVLKTPLHLAHLDALIQTFPNATVVHCHRELEVGISSLCHLIEVARTARGSHPVEPLELGPYLLPHWAAEWAANLQQRDRLQGDAQIIDVDFKQIVSDPAAVITMIHAQRGRLLDVETAARMRRWEQAHPPHPSKGSHGLDRYGINRNDLHRAFARYRERFPAFAN